MPKPADDCFATRLSILDAEWEARKWRARRDPDLVTLHDDPEFDRLYPGKASSLPVAESR